MILTLTLYAPGDGWAIVKEGRFWWLTRPPYGKAARYRLREDQVAWSRVYEDFEVEPIEVYASSWAAMDDLLSERRVHAATPAELEAAEGAAERLLAHASVVQANRHLVRIKSLLAQEMNPGALLALRAILRSPAVQANAEITRELQALLEVS